MSETLYEQDFWKWTRQQARALKARESGGNALDYDNLAEEVESLGRSQRDAVFSYVARIIEHLHKLEISGSDDPKRHWFDEVQGFRTHIYFTITPSIRAMTNRHLEKLHKRGEKYAQISFDEHEPGLQVDTTKRWTLAQILGDKDDPIMKRRRPKS